jgi:hypothetical protein
VLAIKPRALCILSLNYDFVTEKLFEQNILLLETSLEIYIGVNCTKQMTFYCSIQKIETRGRRDKGDLWKK